MKGAILYGPGDVRFVERADPTIIEPTDAIIRLAATCVCGSDLWPYRGIDKVEEPRPMGHEYVGIVKEVGRDVRTLKPGQFVVGSFMASDNTCEICQAGYQSRCAIREFGATDVIVERGDDGVEKLTELSGGLGAHSVIEAVGTQESMMQAIRATRPGGHVGYVGVAHDVSLPGEELFFSEVHLLGGPAPVRRFLPQLVDLIWNREISPGKVFDLTLPLDQVAEGYRAMDERRAIKALLWP